MQLYQHRIISDLPFHQLDWKSKTKNVNCFLLPHQSLLMSHFLFETTVSLSWRPQLVTAHSFQKFALTLHSQKACNTLSAMLLLRYCYAHRLCHLLRNIPPDELRTATIIHDTQTQTTFTKLLNVNDITVEAWSQATFPVRYGGFGMTPAT